MMAWSVSTPVARAVPHSATIRGRRCLATSLLRSATATDALKFATRDEERVVRSTLHELGTQRESMKLSMKIYNFQELSKTSLRDRSLSRDERFENLKQDLRENIDELSPSQLVAAMVSSARLRVSNRAHWWDFARGVERHAVKTKSGSPGLQFSQMSLAMYSVGKARVKIKDRFFYRLLKLMMRHPELWTEFDMAWILNAMRRRRLKPVDEEAKEHRLWAQVQRSIAGHMYNKCHMISPQGLAIILYEFARAEIFPGRVVWKAAKRIQQYMPSLSDKALVCLSVTLAKFDWPEKRLLKKLGKEVQQPHRLVRMHPSMLVAILHSYAKLSVRNVALIKALDDILARSCDNLDARYISALAYSFGRLGVRGKSWEPLAQRVIEKIDRHSPLNLALIAHAFGKVGIRNEALLQNSIPDAALENITGFLPRQLACLLDGLTIVGCYREDLFKVALHEYIRLGSVGGKKRQHMMNRIVFSTALEAPEFLAGAPPAWQKMLKRAKFAEPHAPERPYHSELSLCAFALGVKGQPQRRKGPYVVDLHIPVEQRGDSGPDEPRVLAVHLVAKAEICPLTGEKLGPTRLRKRHLKLMGWKYMSLPRNEWLDLPDVHARVDALQRLLGGYVPIRRRELPLLPDGTSPYDAKPPQLPEGNSAQSTQRILTGEPVGQPLLT